MTSHVHHVFLLEGSVVGDEAWGHDCMAEDRKAGMEDVRHAFEEVVGNCPTEAFSSLRAEKGPRCRKVDEDTRTYLVPVVPVGSRDADMDLGVVRRIWAPGEGNVPVLGVLEALVRLR